jgi:hypothetical protein
MPTDARPLLSLNDDKSVLECRDSENRLKWTLAMKDIVLMAEYTTNEGPFVDDYFLVFVTVENEKLYFASASFYSDGRDEVIQQLARNWATNIELGLVRKTDWNSRVVWPSEMVGREYFEFKEVPPQGLIEKLRQFAFGPVYEYSPSQGVREFIRSYLPQAKVGDSRDRA